MTEFLKTESCIKRSYCGELRSSDNEKQVVLFGWADTIRDHGGIIFIELRDVSGKVQIVFDSSISDGCFVAAETVRNEYVLTVHGRVRMRSEDSINPSLATGDIEVVAETISILSTSTPLPFSISSEEEVNEEVRLKFRYLDLRRIEMHDTLIKRHVALQDIRNYLCKERFIEIDTPVLNKSTPEGARDFLVPSRLSKGSFYALPQSPQLFKQILMVSGFDRYFQTVKCFRDEDLRNDRQPEFTQIDLELSFVTPEVIMQLTEGLIQRIVTSVLPESTELTFPRITYKEAIQKYGTDKPDLRVGFEIVDCTDIFANSAFNVFSQNLMRGGVVRGIAVPDDARLSRVVTDGYSEYVTRFGAGGFPMFKFSNGTFQGGISKFISENEKEMLIKRFQLSEPSVIFFSSDTEDIVNLTLSNMRVKIAKDCTLINDRDLKCVWVTEFPLLEYSKKEARFDSMHHPFTSPMSAHIPMLDQLTPETACQIKAESYDIVLNGVEIGGGSMRINDPLLQKKIFGILGLSDEETEGRFSFLLNALQFGAPPHGGIALGFDRMLMILLRKSSIREVIPFPKTQKGQCLMSGSPTEVSSHQLKELALRTVK